MTDLSREMWYHGRISRTDAERILEVSGAVEGSYLVRDSLTLTGEYVLSLCYQVSLIIEQVQSASHSVRVEHVLFLYANTYNMQHIL